MFPLRPFRAITRSGGQLTSVAVAPARQAKDHKDLIRSCRDQVRNNSVQRLVEYAAFLNDLGLSLLHSLPDQVLRSGQLSVNKHRICIPAKPSQSFSFETNSKVCCDQIPGLFNSCPFFHFLSKYDPNHPPVCLKRVGTH